MRKIKYQVCSQQDVYISIGDTNIDATKIDVLITKDTHEEAEVFALNLPRHDGEKNFMRTYYYENIFIRKVYEL